MNSLLAFRNVCKPMQDVYCYYIMGSNALMLIKGTCFMFLRDVAILDCSTLYRKCRQENKF